MIIFACISPHPPIILPSVGSEEDRKQVKKTIESLEKLGNKLKELKPDLIIISSPHPDWGIKVPLHFLNSKFKVQNAKLQFKIQNYQSPADAVIDQSESLTTYPVLTTLESPKKHYEWGKKFYSEMKNCKWKMALVASGDLSHCLKEDGPYGFHSDGPKFDNALIEALKQRDIEKILKLDKLYPEAGECGLRSFCFLLGILEAAKIDWQTEILSYECPFGVGYLVANFRISRS
jgi:aromatic ring-opening dioxygenase LigB subunit